MVNHVRTLLLNKSVDDLAEESIDCPWYIDEAFVPVRLNSTLLNFSKTLFGSRSTASKIACIKGIVPLLISVDLKKYVIALDPRTTVIEEEVGSIYTLYKNIQSSSDTSFGDVTAIDASYVFLDVRNPIKNKLLKELESISKKSNEYSVRFAALVLAYVYQLDNLLN